MTATNYARGMTTIVVLLLIIAALQALAVILVAQRVIILPFAPSHAAPAPAVDPLPPLPRKSAARPSSISTSAATAGECTNSIAMAHRSAAPALRGQFVCGLLTADLAGTQLAGLSPEGARFRFAGESNTAPPCAHAAAGQLVKFHTHAMQRAQNVSRADEFTARLTDPKTALSFDFKPFARTSAHGERRARHARAHARLLPALQHGANPYFAHRAQSARPAVEALAA